MTRHVKPTGGGKPTVGSKAGAGAIYNNDFTTDRPGSQWEVCYE